MDNKKKRIGYIDIAKAIAIAFIIIGHIGLVYNSAVTPGGVPPIVTQFAFTFHLPVFLIASGYFMHAEKTLTVAQVKKEANSLLKPYVVTCALIIVFCTLSAKAHGLSGSAEAIRWIQASIWGAGARSDVALWDVERIGGIWFFLALFWARIFIFGTSKMRDIPRLALYIAMFFVAIVSARYVWLPFSFQTGMECTLYLYLGMLAKRYDLFNKQKLTAPVIAVCAVVWAIAIVYAGHMSIAMCIYPNGILDFAGALASTACVMKFSQLIEHHFSRLSSSLQVIGRNTLSIFALHIMEDNVVPWGIVGPQIAAALGVGAPLSWLAVIVARFAWIGAICGIVYLVPGLNKIYFPSLRKK